MGNSVLKYAFQFIILVLLQVFLFGNFHYFGFISPFVYIIFLLNLPVGISRHWSLVLAFLLGLCIDIFYNTGGIHAFACVLVMFLRGFWISGLFHIDYAGAVPSVRIFGLVNYSKYAIGIIFLHHACLFLLEAFSLQNLWVALLRTLCNTLITFVLVLSYEFIRK
ncbi:MAG: rod shape-determining protein MreD [Paludibacteraceae bacterium]|nr:rod shape-determining protein MreD [Paludibacteraceae bacterium]